MLSLFLKSSFLLYQSFLARLDLIKINYVKHPDSQLSKHDLRLSAQLLMVGVFSFYHGLQRGRAWKAGAESLVRSDRGCDIIAIWRREMLDG